MVMCFETDVIVDTEAYDTRRIQVVNIFFRKLIRLSIAAWISCCVVDGKSDAISLPAVPPGPEKFARTDTATKSSYRVPAGLLISPHRAMLGFFSNPSQLPQQQVSCLKPSIIPPISDFELMRILSSVTL